MTLNSLCEIRVLMSYALECVCGSEQTGRMCYCPKGLWSVYDKYNPRRVYQEPPKPREDDKQDDKQDDEKTKE